MYIYVCSLHVSVSYVSIIRRINCINTTSGIYHSVWVTFWYALFNGDPPKRAYQTATHTEWYIPDVVLIQLTLLMMSARLLETSRELK